MTGKVKEWYRHARQNGEFNREMEDFDETFRGPGVFSDSKDKHFYLAVYMGWRCGKGLDKLD